MNVIFEVPERYVQREVRMGELAGEWKVTTYSEEKLNEFRATFPDWPDLAPWKTIQLNEDGTCQVKLEIQWLPDYTNSRMPKDLPDDVLSNSILACSWKTARISGITNRGNENVPGIEISIDYPNNYSRDYSLYIYEENGKLILWTFIGDPDDFVSQDFIRSQD